MREANVVLLKRAYAAFSKGDLDTIRDISTEDCVWRTPGYPHFEAEYKGRDGIIQYLTKLVELTDGTFKVEPTAFMADDDQVMVLSHVTASRLGRLLDAHAVHVYDVHDGKVFETTEFVSEPKKLEAFWA